MNAWRVAWRVRLTALAVSPVPALLTALIFFLEYQAEFAFFAGEPAFVVLDTAYFAAEALFLGMLLEALFVDDGPPATRDAMRPRSGALRFAAAMAPVGLVAVLLQLGLHGLLAESFEGDLAGNPGAEPGLAHLWFEAVTSDPAVQWLLGGLMAPAIAVRTLKLEQMASRPVAIPSLGLVAMVIEAVVLAVLLYRGTGAAADRLGLFGLWLSFATWYLIAMLTLTLIATAIGLMLRARV